MSEIQVACGCVFCTGPPQDGHRPVLEVGLQQEIRAAAATTCPETQEVLRFSWGLSWECTTTTACKHFQTYLLQVRREKHLNQHWVFHNPAFLLTPWVVWDVRSVLRIPNQLNLLEFKLHLKSVLTLYRECTGTSKIISGFDHWGACGKCPSSEKSKKAGKPLRFFRLLRGSYPGLVILKYNRNAFLALRPSIIAGEQNGWRLPFLLLKERWIRLSGCCGLRTFKSFLELFVMFQNCLWNFYGLPTSEYVRNLKPPYNSRIS